MGGNLQVSDPLELIGDGLELLLQRSGDIVPLGKRHRIQMRDVEGAR
jgi:hypothetical protein